MKAIVCLLMLYVLLYNDALAANPPFKPMKKRSSVDRQETSCLEGDPNCRGRESKKQQQEVTNIAQKAAEDAKKAAEAQQPVAQQAAMQVKSQLADKAAEAAQAAQAALAGKMVVVEQLEQEFRDAESVAKQEAAEFTEAQNEALATSKVKDMSNIQLKNIESALSLQDKEVSKSATAVDGAQREVNEKMQLVEAAKERMDELQSELTEAKQDLASTKQAAQKAEQAAQSAKEHVTSTGGAPCVKCDPCAQSNRAVKDED